MVVFAFSSTIVIRDVVNDLWGVVRVGNVDLVREVFVTVLLTPHILSGPIQPEVVSVLCESGHIVVVINCQNFVQCQVYTMPEFFPSLEDAKTKSNDIPVIITLLPAVRLLCVLHTMSLQSMTSTPQVVTDTKATMLLCMSTVVTGWSGGREAPICVVGQELVKQSGEQMTFCLVGSTLAMFRRPDAFKALEVATVKIGAYTAAQTSGTTSWSTVSRSVQVLTRREMNIWRGTIYTYVYEANAGEIRALDFIDP